jgi:phosphoribosylglycinamide formyltransferase 1
MTKLRLGVQISGRGSNLQALIDACRDPEFPAEIAIVISNVPSVHGLTRAEDAHIATRVIPHKDFPTREAFEEALDTAHRNMGVDLICNAGFMRIITPYLVGRWRGKMINIHPSLLPDFPGLHTHKKAIEAHKAFAGCTVHYVEEGVDSGAIILQAKVPVLKGDTEDVLAARVLEAEHKIYPLSVRFIADGDVRYDKGSVIRSEKAKAALESLT